MKALHRQGLPCLLNHCESVRPSLAPPMGSLDGLSGLCYTGCRTLISLRSSLLGRPGWGHPPHSRPALLRCGEWCRMGLQLGSRRIIYLSSSLFLCAYINYRRAWGQDGPQKTTRWQQGHGNPRNIRSGGYHKSLISLRKFGSVHCERKCAYLFLSGY